MFTVLFDTAIKVALAAAIIVAATAHNFWPRKICHGTSLMNPNDHICTYYIGR